MGGRRDNIRQGRRSAAGRRGWGTVGEEQQRTHMGPLAASRVVSTMRLRPDTYRRPAGSEFPGIVCARAGNLGTPLPSGNRVPTCHGGALLSQEPPSPLVITLPYVGWKMS